MDEGVVEYYDFNRQEAAERFLVKIRELMMTSPDTWLGNNTFVEDLFGE